MEDVKDVKEVEAQEAEAKEPTPERHETDWKAEARKWESRAKELLGSKDAETARAEDAEARLAEATRAKEHAEAVVSVSASSGVPADFLAFCSDREQMEAFGRLWAEYHAAPEQQPPHAGVKAPERRLVSSGAAKLANRDVFASLFTK